jgi:hypothetical protein
MFVLIVGVIVPAAAGGFTLDSVFAQVYSEKVTVVDAGISAYATYHKDFGDQAVAAVAPNPGNVTVLWDEYGITAPTRWLRIVTVVKDVKGNQITDIKQAFVTPANERSDMGVVCKVASPYEIWIDGASLPDFVRFTPVVVQNASKKERTIFWIFHVVNHFERENTTDVFITLLDVSEELSEDLIVDQPQLGLTQAMLEDVNRPDQITRFFRSYLYDRYPLQLIKTIAPYQIKADGRAQRVQGDTEAGFRAEIAKLTAAYEQKLEAYQGKVDELIAKLNAAQEAEAEAVRKAADERLANPPTPVTTTTTMIETATEAAQPRLEAPVARCNWRLNLPPGKVVVEVETIDGRGSKPYRQRYAGYIPMNNYIIGQDLWIKLTFEGNTDPEPWKVIRDVQSGKIVNYQNLGVR